MNIKIFCDIADLSSIRKFNNLDNVAITIISEIPPRIASGNKDINSLFLDLGR